MIISIDFDGTIVREKWPEIGRPIPGALAAIRKLHAAGHTIIINSCRAQAPELAMREWLEEHLPGCIDYINENSLERTTRYGGDCRKISADIYIDDKNIFCEGINWKDILEEIQYRQWKIHKLSGE